MSLTSSEMSAADIAAVTGNDGFGNGNGAWWIILFLFALGWGGYGYGGYGNGGNNGVDAYMQRGFDQTAVMSGNKWSYFCCCQRFRQCRSFQM